jgi:hypothetical protein
MLLIRICGKILAVLFVMSALNYANQHNWTMAGLGLFFGLVFWKVSSGKRKRAAPGDL